MPPFWVIHLEETGAEIYEGPDPWRNKSLFKKRLCGCSITYQTYQDAINSLGTGGVIKPCSFCGNTIDIGGRYDSEEIAKTGWCSTCYFWFGIKSRNFDRRIIFNGVHYLDGGFQPASKASQKTFLGFSGADWFILFHDPERKPLYTNNLWCQGSIPSLFIERHPEYFADNAVTLKKEDWLAAGGEIPYHMTDHWQFMNALDFVYDRKKLALVMRNLWWTKERTEKIYNELRSAGTLKHEMTW